MLRYATKALNWAGRNPGTVLNGGLGLYLGMDSYQEAREAGDGRIVAMGQAGAEFALGTLMGWGYIGFQAVTSAPSLAFDVMYQAELHGRQMQVANSGRAFQTAVFSDSDQAYTMRQAGMAVAQRSRYNTQQAMLGNEAKYMMK